MDKHASVGPVHESRISGEHGIDYIVVVIHVVIPAVTNNQRIQQRTITRFSGKSGSYTLDFFPVARRLALNLSRLVHVPVLPQQSDLQLIQIPDAQVQRLVLLPRILHHVESAPRLLRQSFLQQAADPVLHVGPLERNRVRGDPLSAIANRLLPPRGEPSLLVARGSGQYGPVILVYQVTDIRLLRLPPPPRLAVVQRDLAHVREIRVFHGRPGLARLRRGLLLLLIVIVVVVGGGGYGVVVRVRGGGRDDGSPRDRRLTRRVVGRHGRALAGRDLRAELLLHRRDPLQPTVHVGYGAWRRGGAGWRWAGHRRLRHSGRRRVQCLLGEGCLVVVQILRWQRLVVELELPSRLPAPTAATDFPRPEF